jgi:GNAT superfamily N-acetyltransferase
MTRRDLNWAASLSALAGWNQTGEDWLRLLNLEPGGCFVADWDGAPAGTATTTCYGKELAWVGMVLVEPDQRGHGIGTALLEHCLACLQRRGIRCIKLDATPQGRPLYERLGFKAEWTLQRWETGAVKRPVIPTLSRIRPLRDTDHAALKQLDTAAFGVNRWALLCRLRCQISRTLLHESPKGRVTGLGMVRKGTRAAYLGPVVATSFPFAGALVKALLATLPNRAVYWDIPDHQNAALELAGQLGFIPQRPFVRMFLGENSAPGQPSMIFGIAAPEVG